MKPRVLTAISSLAVMAVGVAAGPLPHVLAANYTQHMQLLEAYPLDHPVWMARMGQRGS